MKFVKFFLFETTNINIVSIMLGVEIVLLSSIFLLS